MRNRKGWAALLALWMLLSTCALAETAALRPAKEEATLPGAQSVQAILDRLASYTPEDRRAWLTDSNAKQKSPLKHGILLGHWYINGEGFAFSLPDGYALQENYRGAAIMLVGEAGHKGFQPSIGLALVDVDEDLLELTQEQIDTIYEKSIPQYQPVAFDHIEHAGIPMLSLAYTQGREGDAQLYFQQLLFNHGKHCYILTMTTAQADSKDKEAAFAKFLQSMVFATPVQDTEDLQK